MFLSIIIPVYNAEHTITRLFDSILNQKTHNLKLEIIAVNDGSSDNSLNNLNNYARQFNFIKVFSTQNQGVYKTRNFALNKVKGDYIWMLDADDYISSDAFHLLEKLLSETIDVLHFSYYVEDKLGKTGVKLTPKKTDSIVDGVSFLKANDGRLYLWNNVYNTNFIKKYNLSFLAQSVSLEDSLFNISVFSKAKKVKYLNTPLYTYVFQANSISRKKDLTHLTNLGESSYNVHLCTKKIRDNFMPNERSYKVINDCLSHSILGFFYSLIIEKYPFNYVKKMYYLYEMEGLFPVTKDKNSMKVQFFQNTLNCKWLYLVLSRLNQFRKTQHSVN